MINCKGVLAPTVRLTVCASVSGVHGPNSWMLPLHLFPVVPGMETACGAEDGHTARPCKCKREGVREQRPGEDGARACMGGCLRARTTMHEVVSGYVS
jgi:hypothetical protein